MSLMRFAVDAHAIGRHLTGNEIYVRSLLRCFADLDHESEFITYVSAGGAEEWIPQRFQVRRVAASPVARLGWDIARLVAKDRPDVLHVQYTGPLFSQIPLVATVHDVSFLEHPEYFTASRRLQLRHTVERTVRRASRIITVSEFSRSAILRRYRISPEKVRVIPNAANPEFRVIGREKALRQARAHLGFQVPFILSVGDLQPRKNQIGLIEAFAHLIAENPHCKHHLVLTGQETWFTPRVRAAALASGLNDRIHFTGFVSDDKLLSLYNACECFVFPSFYEGFGIPILEAMACGRAVACSNTSSMPEVADGAALLFDPHDPQAIKRAIADILKEGELRNRMERLGLQRAASFSWQKSAEATLAVYREAAAGGSRGVQPSEAALAELAGAHHKP